jgi:hypothetical protein
MKHVYVAIINGEISAFHEKKSIMKDYLSKYKNSNPKDKCSIGKMPRICAYQMREYEDLYLEDCGMDLYIQSKYVDAYLVMIIPEEYEIQDIIDGIYYTLENMRCNKKQRKKLIASLETLTEIQAENGIPYIPPLRVLEQEYWQLEEFRRNAIY